MGYKKYTCGECNEDKWRKTESKEYPWCYDCFQELYKFECFKCRKKMKQDYKMCYQCKFLVIAELEIKSNKWL